MIRVIIIIKRANEAGTFDACPHNSVEMRGIHEGAAIWQAVKFASGRAYRIEFYGDGDTPFRTLEQLALPAGQFEIKPGLETPKSVQIFAEGE